ncbi:MAG: hypothetical protein ACQEWI_07070 [Bacillota bacterium]
MCLYYCPFLLVLQELSYQEEKATTQTTEKQGEKPKAQMASTTTSPSPFADTIIKDEQSVNRANDH